MFLRLILIIALFAVLFGTYVRLAPVDPGTWHVDPETADAPGGKGAVLMAADSPLWTEPSADLLGKLDDIATQNQSTTLVAGTPTEGRMTYMTRSQIWGFPDFTTVAGVETPAGTQLSIISRARFGAVDLGVNQQRIDDWLAALTETLPPQ